VKVEGSSTIMRRLLGNLVQLYARIEPGRQLSQDNKRRRQQQVFKQSMPDAQVACKVRDAGLWLCELFVTLGELGRRSEYDGWSPSKING
jgi:hypothetical protein